jgi:hypothetical protein
MQLCSCKDRELSHLGLLYSHLHCMIRMSHSSVDRPYIHDTVKSNNRNTELT